MSVKLALYPCDIDIYINSIVFFVDDPVFRNRESTIPKVLSGMVDPTPPPEELKPWYYQDWFIFPTVVFWPLWAVLIIRSPWHNGLISGAVAWAMLIVGTYWIIWEQLVKLGRLYELTIALIIPGVLLTLFTQFHWIRYRPFLRTTLLKGTNEDNQSEIRRMAAYPKTRRRLKRRKRTGRR